MFISLFLCRKWGENSAFAVCATLPFYSCGGFLSSLAANIWQICITKHHCVTMSCSPCSSALNNPCSFKETDILTKKKSQKNLENGRLKYTMKAGARCLPGMRLILVSGETLSKLLGCGLSSKIAFSALTMTRNKLSFFIFKESQKVKSSQMLSANRMKLN